jgi:hypothetical protein
MLGLAQEQTNNIRRQNLSYLDRHVVTQPEKDETHRRRREIITVRGQSYVWRLPKY